MATTTLRFPYTLHRFLASGCEVLRPIEAARWPKAWLEEQLARQGGKRTDVGGRSFFAFGEREEALPADDTAFDQWRTSILGPRRYAVVERSALQLERIRAVWGAEYDRKVDWKARLERLMGTSD